MQHLVAILAGTFLGGLLTNTLGLGRALWIFGVIQTTAHLGYAAVAQVGVNRPLMYAAQAFEMAAGGMGTGAFSVLLLRLTQKRFSATQYALLSSLFSLPRILAGPVAGPLAGAVRGLEQAREAGEQGRLARAAGPEEQHGLPRWNVEVERPQRPGPTGRPAPSPAAGPDRDRPAVHTRSAARPAASGASAPVRASARASAQPPAPARSAADATVSTR